MSWIGELLDNGERHVWPSRDLKPHETSKECWCRPFDDDGVTVHNAMDQREQYERGRKTS